MDELDPQAGLTRSIGLGTRLRWIAQGFVRGPELDRCNLDTIGRNASAIIDRATARMNEQLRQRQAQQEEEG